MVGMAIAAATSLPHRREPPLGSDQPADLSAADFMRLLARIAWQGDGGMGGWDDITGVVPGRHSLITGHFGELLKAYAKQPPQTPLDPAAMVRLQSPFDPLDLIRPDARTRLTDLLAEQMATQGAAGAREADLPDLFYWRNRIPNWLGGIRGIKSFERQPMLPLGVPALMRLAFAMTPEERGIELAHFRILQRVAPALLPIPFAHQSWSAALADAPRPAPVLATEGAPLFGSWQWSVNRNPAVRERMVALFAGMDIPLWTDVDRAALLTVLRERRIEYREGISLLGLAVAAFHQAGLVERRKLGDAASAELSGPLGTLATAPDGGVATRGHVDAAVDTETGVTISGWAQAPDWPGASPVVEARAEEGVMASAAAALPRSDLCAAGIGDGRYGFTLTVARSAGAATPAVTVACAGSQEPLIDGVLAPGS
jgi:hypothetical protein